MLSAEVGTFRAAKLVGGMLPVCRKLPGAVVGREEQSVFRKGAEDLAQLLELLPKSGIELKK